jgi:hypothetical protein
MNWQHCYPAYGIAMLMLYDAHVEGGGGEIALPFDRNELHCHFLVSFFCCFVVWIAAPFAAKMVGRDHQVRRKFRFPV